MHMHRLAHAYTYLACRHHGHASTPPISIFTHSKCPVNRANAQYGEKLRLMVERLWALAWDTTVLLIDLT